MFLTSCQSTKNATGSVSRPSSQNSQGTSNSSPALSSSQTTNPVQTKIDEEYARSVNTVNVSKSKFTEDKAEIMRIIGELDTVMSKNDFSTWKSYIDNESITYWSSPKNLSKASGMLPVKGLKMTNLKDYFTHVFVPSRRGRKVDEIRYTSPLDVKAVQVNRDTDIIYYYFRKVGNKWYVTLPPLSN